MEAVKKKEKKHNKTREIEAESDSKGSRDGEDRCRIMGAHTQRTQTDKDNADV